MSYRPVRRALISVYDKTGIVDFARVLQAEFGVEIIATGGTARLLAEQGVPSILVEQLTGFPEMLGGRVKTLHPAIHAAILADRDNSEHLRQLAAAGLEPIDLVVVNLYPFARAAGDAGGTFEQAVEMIDIGGVALLRAAAKNHRYVAAISDREGCRRLLELLHGRADERGWREFRGQCALKAFQATAAYDGEIAAWLETASADGAAPADRTLRLRRLCRLRYGENPHQSAELLGEVGLAAGRAGLLAGEADGDAGVALSYNNCLDADAAVQLCRELAGAGAVVLPPSDRLESQSPGERGRQGCVWVFTKHTNPCGVGMAEDSIEAYRRAYLGDPNAAMGGVLAGSFPVTAPVAEAVTDTLARWGRGAGARAFFVEVWIAPTFDPAAVEVIRRRPGWGGRVRLLAVGDMLGAAAGPLSGYRSIAGGLLVQDGDAVGLDEEQWKVVSDRRPSEREWADLRLAWLTAKHTKSNAVSICRDGLLIGNGAGQMSRVMSCRVATWLARENGHGDALAGAVAASDGFFPFRDGPDVLIDAGVTAIVQPGGSKRDAEVIAASDERGVAMVVTGTRHFRH